MVNELDKRTVVSDFFLLLVHTSAISIWGCVMVNELDKRTVVCDFFLLLVHTSAIILVI